MIKSIRCIYLITLCLLALTVKAQQEKGYWQQQVDHQIDVSLNTNDHTLEGFETITYTNNSPDTLSFIWFHLWPNAYKNDRTAFSDQQLMNNQTAFYFANKEQRGYINRLEFKVQGVLATTEDHPSHIDIVKVLLPTPLLPGHSATITTPFHVRLPHIFSRSGYADGMYQVTQWYPKPAVYDKNGWHPMPYLDQGEFYNEFGNYEVRITLPVDYVVAATGTMHDENEKKWMLERQVPKIATPQKLTATSTKEKTGVANIDAQQYKTLHFSQEQVHDFAWFASKDFVVKSETVTLPGNTVDAFIYYRKQEEDLWTGSLETIAKTLHQYSSWIGTYPYQTMSVVSGVQNAAGGMEYPTITVVHGITDSALLATIITHEIGHNWFQGMLANNERTFAWLDEGLNTYYDKRYHTSNNSPEQAAYDFDIYEQILFETQARQKLDQPVNIPAIAFSDLNYGLSSYYKAGAIFKKIETIIGHNQFDLAIQLYFSNNKFKHIHPADLQNAFETVTGFSLDSLFQLFNKTGSLQPGVKKPWKVYPVFNLKEIIKDAPTTHSLLVSPVLGFNSYDKLLAGGVITNYKIPTSSLQFLIAPVYGTGSKKWNGLGNVNYSLFPTNTFRKIDLFVNASRFSMNDFVNNDGDKTITSFHKIVPGARFNFKQKDTRQLTNRYIQWKTFFIDEESLRFTRDTIITGTDTSYLQKVGKIGNNRSLHQLTMRIENFRALYPYSVQLKAEQGKNFIRTGFEGQYFFNYGIKGGLNLRFFAGKFFYTGSKTTSTQFATERYHLNMTGVNGYEDYTYRNYFVGRNEFEGFASQQLMIRDGAFKVRTDLLAEKIGRSDDWLMSLNLTSSIPDALNPLQVLPVKIPLKIFADIGTYAEGWNRNGEADRFLYNAGLQVSLFKNVVNIYIPVLYSKVYKDYIRSTITEKRLLKTISFSIDLEQLEDARFRQWFAF